MRRQRVIFIGGAWRSGTTLLGNILATSPGAEHVGEIEYLLHAKDPGDSQCGCGLRLRDCPLWRDIVGGTFDFARWHHLRDTTMRMKHLPRQARRWSGGGPPPAYARMLGELYHSIGAQGVGTIVDSTKRASAALSAIAAPGTDVHVVHLVRDPRAVAYSLNTRLKRQGATGEGRLTRRRSAAQSSAKWLTANALLDRYVRPAAGPGRYRVVRYEDLTRHPRSVCEDIAGWAGLDPSTLAFTDESVVELRPTHTVMGNPNRFVSGPVTITPDTEWQELQGSRDRAIASAVAAPTMRTYGYRQRVR
jgi:hypothetical protein